MISPVLNTMNDCILEHLISTAAPVFLICSTLDTVVGVVFGVGPPKIFFNKPLYNHSGSPKMPFDLLSTYKEGQSRPRNV
jgi:hypothetical protein